MTQFIFNEGFVSKD